MVILKELEIKNCFSVKHVILSFEANNYATIFNCSTTNSLKSDLIYAVKCFFCKDMALCRMGSTPGCQQGLSIIRIKFIIFKPENQRNIIVDAMRLFSQPNFILYYLNGEQYIDLIQVFHERCQLDALVSKDFCANIHSNLMHHCGLDTYQFDGDNNSFIELLADYLDISHSQQISEQKRIENYMQMSLLIDRECEMLKKRTFVHIINEIGYIFKYITFEEYSVKFIIPLFEEMMFFQDMNWDCINLSETQIWVKKTNCDNSCLCNELEPGLREIMKIAQIIALAKHLQKKCIFIEDTTVLERYQNQEMIKEAIESVTDIDSSINWSKKNFLGRIVEICSRLKIMIFINYSGILPPLDSNTNIIKCSSAAEQMYLHI